MTAPIRRAIVSTVSGLVAAKCPSCGVMNDAVTGIGLDSGRGRPKPVIPKPGDITMCAYCHVVLKFTKSMQFRLVTQFEFNTLDPTVRKIIGHYTEDYSPARKTQ